jgi:ABC-type lipoprotein export system ATPase subunit
MLVSFSLENYFSFKEKQTFYMLPIEGLERRNNLLKKAPETKVLPTALIYGSNGSGKSLLLNALYQCIQNLNMNYTNHNLNSNFELRFIGKDQKEYGYVQSFEALGFENKNKIIHQLYQLNHESKEWSLIDYDKSILKSFTDNFVFFKNTHQIMIPHLFKSLEESRKKVIQDMLDEIRIVDVNDDTINYQSTGTLQFIDILNTILDVLEKGKILICDDFGTNLSFDNKELLIGFFHSHQGNTNFRKAQLILTTNDSALMAYHFVAIDQIHLISHSYNKTSFINRASDYIGVDSKNVHKYYIIGKIGGKAGVMCEAYNKSKVKEFLKYRLDR